MRTPYAVAALVLLAACTSDGPAGPAPNNEGLARVLKEAATFHKQGRSLLEKGKATEAIIPLRQAIRLGQPGHTVHSELGRALLDSGQVHEARGAFGMALSLKPGDAALLTLLGRAQLKSGYPRQATASFRAAKKKMPGDPQLAKLLTEARTEAAERGKAADYLAQGTTLVREGKHAEAVKAFQESVRRQPFNVDANFRLGEVLCKLGRHAEAVEPLKKVISRSPRHSDAFFLLGLAQARQGKKKEAAEQLEQAINMRMQDIEFHLRAAGELVRANLLTEAAVLLKRALGFKLQSAADKGRQLCALWLVQSKLGQKEQAAAALARVPGERKVACHSWLAEVKEKGWQ